MRKLIEEVSEWFLLENESKRKLIEEVSEWFLLENESKLTDGEFTRKDRTELLNSVNKHIKKLTDKISSQFEEGLITDVVESIGDITLYSIFGATIKGGYNLKNLSTNLSGREVMDLSRFNEKVNWDIKPLIEALEERVSTVIDNSESNLIYSILPHALYPLFKGIMQYMDDNLTFKECLQLSFDKVKRGDGEEVRLICIDNSGFENILTEGKAYTQHQTSLKFVEVTNDLKQKRYYTKDRFKVIREV